MVLTTQAFFCRTANDLSPKPDLVVPGLGQDADVLGVNFIKVGHGDRVPIAVTCEQLREVDRTLCLTH